MRTFLVGAVDLMGHESVHAASVTEITGFRQDGISMYTVAADKAACSTTASMRTWSGHQAASGPRGPTTSSSIVEQHSTAPDADALSGPTGSTVPSTVGAR